MAKKLIQRAMQRLNMIPDKEKIAQNKSLKFLGDKLHQPHLWHINRHSVARAFAVGGFAMYTPPLPWQMVIAAILAVYFEANLPISVALVWITNPLTWIPLYYIAYNLGAFLTGREGYSFDDFKNIFDSLGDAWENLGAPFLVGCLGMMILCAIAGYFGIQMFWRYHVMKAWEHRKQKRRDAQRRVFESMDGGIAAEPIVQQTALFALLDKYWKQYAAPALETAKAIMILGVNAVQAGFRAACRYYRVMNTWSLRQLRRRAPIKPVQETALEATTRLVQAWQTQGVPLLRESVRIILLGGKAGLFGLHICRLAGKQLWGQYCTQPKIMD